MQGNEIVQPDFRGIVFIFNKVKEVVSPFYETYILDFLEPYFPAFAVLSNIAIVAFLAGIIFVIVRSRSLNKMDAEFYKPIDVEKVEGSAHKVQWDIILDHVNSQNKAEWKIAIIEADSILDGILKEIGYEGDTLADRLKSAGNGVSVQQAWEAHKVRNEIAHEGGMELTHHEAKKVISMYENVFKRFGYL